MSTDKHPESVPALLASLRHLAATQPKAVRGTVHIYPAEVYAHDAGHDAGVTIGLNGDGCTSSSRAARRDRRITSWKMTEHMYFQRNNPFPTLARGLFTEELEDEADKLGKQDTAPVHEAGVEENAGESSTAPERRRRDRIVARGYDKFFNIDEVAWTNVRYRVLQAFGKHG